MWLGSKQAKALLGGDFQTAKLSREGEGNSIKAITPSVATTYWGCAAQFGNKKAIALLLACAQETLERRLMAVLLGVPDQVSRRFAG